jgi:hypothetical protein
MTRRPGRADTRRIMEPRGFSLRIGILTALQIWAAVTGFVDLHAGGIFRLALTLLAVITILLDAWHELRTPPCTGSDSSISLNHVEENSDARSSERGFPFPPKETPGNDADIECHL